MTIGKGIVTSCPSARDGGSLGGSIVCTWVPNFWKSKKHVSRNASGEDGGEGLMINTVGRTDTKDNKKQWTLFHRAEAET